MRYARMKDGNHTQVLQALKAGGAEVFDTAHAGRGVPDLFVLFLGWTVAVEVKDGSLPPSARTLTPAEEAWRERWVRAGGEYRVVESTAHALEVLAQYRALGRRTP